MIKKATPSKRIDYQKDGPSFSITLYCIAKSLFSEHERLPLISTLHTVKKIKEKYETNTISVGGRDRIKKIYPARGSNNKVKY